MTRTQTAALLRPLSTLSRFLRTPRSCATAIAMAGLAGALALPQAAWSQPAPPAPPMGVAPPAPMGAAPARAAPATPTVRIRGTVVYADAAQLIVKDRGGEVVTLARVPDLPVSEVYPIRIADITKGSYIGTAAMPQPDGTQRALGCWCSRPRRVAPAKATSPGTWNRRAP